MEPTTTTDDVEFSFGSFLLLPGQQLLVHAGSPVPIGSRSLDLLTALVERAGQVVSKEQLIRLAWPTTVVDATNLKAGIGSLRRALECSPDAEGYIATVRGQGYRFDAPVSVRHGTPQTFEDAIPTSASGLIGDRAPVGRSDDVRSLAALLARHRLVTVTGPGGVGKTTVAISVARYLIERDDLQVRKIDFSTVGAAEFVPTAIALALGIRPDPDDPIASVVRLMRDRRVLLLFDNCEHLLEALSPLATRLVAETSGLRILATSREPLHSRVEQVAPLPGLDWPTEGGDLTARHAAEFSAVQLFVERANALGSFILSDENATDVANICERLDGLPLAIELAASKVSTLGLEQLMGSLERNLDSLDSGVRAAPARHQTLMAMLDWSYRLLSDDEASIFRMLSVFAGTFAPGDALALAVRVHPHLSTERVAKLLDNIVAKSMVSADGSSETASLRLLESTRDYASRRLEAEGETPAVRRHHARHMLVEMERAAEDWHWQATAEWVARHAGRIDDLRSAIDASFGPDGEALVGIRLTAAAIPLWDELSSIVESAARVERALQAVHELNLDEPAIKLRLMMAKAWSMMYATQLRRGTGEAWLQCFQLARECGDVEHQLRALWGLAVYESYVGRQWNAIGHLERFVHIANAEHELSALPDGERLLSLIEIYVGKLRPSLQRLTHLAEQFGRSRHRSRIARFQIDRYVTIRASLAIALWLSGSPDQAAQVAQNAVDGAADIGHTVSHANALAQAALPIALLNGDGLALRRFVHSLRDDLARHDIPIWKPVCRLYAGASEECDRSQRVEALQAALDDVSSNGVLVRTPWYLSLLAEAMLDRGSCDSALATIKTALARSEEQGERWCMPEALRVHGRVLLALQATEAAEQALLSAIDLASKMGARAWHLRAAIDLAGHWHLLSRTDSAIAVLEPILQTYSEGFGTKDLRAASALLADMRADVGGVGLAGP